MVSKHLEEIETANWLHSYHNSDFLTMNSFFVSIVHVLERACVVKHVLV